MNILGISAFYHDSAACLVQNGNILSAAQEERFTRKKHDHSFPEQAIQFCLNEAGILTNDIDFIAYYDKPFLKFERILESYLSYAPKGIASFLKSMPLWIKQKLWIKELIRNRLNFSGRIVFPEHHESHAASAFFASPFREAAFITLDGVGEWVTSSFGIGQDNHIDIHSDIPFPHSLGLLYTAFTYYTGFRVNSGEYKIMGLAPYGKPKYKSLIYKHLIDVKEDGSFKLNMKYFNYCAGLTMTNTAFNRLFGGAPRKPESPIDQRIMDLTRSVQEVLEETVLKIAKHVRRSTGMKNLCLAGGVALNCVANGRLLRNGVFDKIWIQPASGDAGGALGAALYAWYQILENERHTDEQTDAMHGAFLGPGYTDKEIKRYLTEKNYPFMQLSKNTKAEKVADLIKQGNIIGWFQGRMEFGPRALGARSIIGDPRSPLMQEKMNLKIKYRESFRPFAPSVLEEHAAEFFDLDEDSPYMLLVGGVNPQKIIPMTDNEKQLFGLEKLKIPRSSIPAVTHVDYSARIQTVQKSVNPDFYHLISEFYAKTGCPVLVNTSFNIRGEPIVCSPEDAYRSFMSTEMDYLVMGNYLLDKSQQPHSDDKQVWRAQFPLD